MIKRTCDIVLSALGLVVLSPLLLLLAVLVKLDSRGPVFFRQRRIGKDGHPFWIVKFRTMVDNAYTLGSRLTHKHDPRITRVGQVLRWLKLDELPQLWNVLNGDMSLVGPRPEDPHFVHMYTPEQRAVLSVRPGVVGPNQILGRNEIEKYPDDCIDTERYYVEQIMPEKLATDLEYVRTCGFLGDIRLIAAGLGATLFGAFRAKFLHLNRRRLFLLLFDTLASLAVYHLSFGLKLDRSHPEAFQYALMMSVLIFVVRPPLFLYFGLYQNILRYVGASEFLAIGRAVTVGSVVISALAFFLGYQQHSRQVLLMDWGLLIVVLFGVRIAMKTWLAYHPLGRDEPRKNVLIVGADDTGEHLASALVNLKAPSYRPIGFLDDDPAKRGAIINGIRVLGRTHDLPVVAAIERVDLVVILFAKGTSGALRASIDYCRAHNLQYRLLPTLDRLLDGDLIMPELRELNGGDAAAAAIGDGGDQNGSPAGLAEGPGETSPAVHLRSGPHAGPVLVTGGAGYIGSHVVRKLLASGRRVRVVDNYLYGDHGLREVLGHPLLEVIEGDVRHLRTMAVAVKGVDSVIALAALVGDAACDLDPEETISINVEATQLLADVCERARVPRLVFASSCSVYGANSELILNEGSWLNPISLYAQSRIKSEDILLRHTERVGVTILRLATVFGLSPRMRLDLLVNTFTAHAFFNRKIRIFGGQQWRPHLHVQDAADAFIRASTAPDERVHGEVFNVGHSVLNSTVLEVAELVKGMLPRTQIEVTDTIQDRRDYRVGFDKIRHVLDFQTRFRVDDGIREIVTAFQRGQITTPEDERHHNFRYLKTHGHPAVVGAGR